MGQIVSTAAKPKRCNKNQLSQLGVLAAGVYVLVSSDDSMNAAGQGNFDCYIVGDGITAATALELKNINELKTPFRELERVVRYGSEEDAFYITDSQGNAIAKFDSNGISATDVLIPINSELSSILSVLSSISSDYENLSEGCEQLKDTLNDLLTKIVDNYKDSFYISDSDGNVILKVDADGIKATSFIDKNGNKIYSIMQARPYYENMFAIADEKGNVILKADGNGVFSLTLQKNDWFKKSVGFYGDSITEINNGDFNFPYGLSNKYLPLWANQVGNYFTFSNVYGRGIGSQSYTWKNGGGTVAWVSPTGVPLGRAAGFSYDDFDGTSYPTGITQEMEQSGDAIRIRGCFASWLRITKSFPLSIKDSIDAVIIMGGTNDFQASFSDASFTNINTSVEWIDNDATDAEWAADTDNYRGGDFNLTTFRGAIASTIMKFSVWMPNALIIIATPLSGNNKATQGGYGNVTSFETDANGKTMEDYANAIKEVAHQFSFPCIDIFGNTMITIFNREGVIDDQFHPYTIAARNLLARAMSCGLKTIIPRFN